MLQGSFYILGMGSVLSLLILLAEFVFAKSAQGRNKTAIKPFTA
jgi:Na+-transporting methylmalonyl-CoA/oxaloacetate decarboxylase gamma subunit